MVENSETLDAEVSVTGVGEKEGRSSGQVRIIMTSGKRFSRDCEDLDPLSRPLFFEALTAFTISQFHSRSHVDGSEAT